MKIVAMSCCVMDIFPQLNKQYVGGNSVNFAIQCKRSGVREVAVVGAVGNDPYGTRIINRLEKEKIDVSHLYTIEGFTATHAILVAARGERLFFPENWQGGVFEHFSLSSKDWEFVNKHDIIASVANDPNFGTLLKKKKQKNKLIIDYLNTQDLKMIKQHSDRVDITFLSGHPELVNPIKAYSRNNKNLILVSLGAEGTHAILDGKSFFQPAIPVEKVIDATGCADAYLAAFTVAWYKYRDINKALISGAQAAARVSTYPGAV